MAFSHSFIVQSLFLIVVFTMTVVNSTRSKGGIHVADGVLYYANFAPFLNHKLNDSEVMKIRTVADEEECLGACTEDMECGSVNFKITPDESGEHICQLLGADKFSSYNEFNESLDFHHYSFTAPCEDNPCQNGGTCFAVNGWNDFKCECPPSLCGKRCDESPYRSCLELLNAGIRKTGMHMIPDKAWMLPFYCDQDFMGGGWTMVFKVVAGTEDNIQNMWSSDKSAHQTRKNYVNVGSLDKAPYKSRKIARWETLDLKEARVALYRNEHELLSIVFNATGSDRENWFSKNRLIQSPWTDLETEQQNYFSVLGDLASGRGFYINKKNNSCDSDFGWLMASSGKLCDYESRHSLAAFTYSKLETNVNWNEYENVGIADVLAVFIR